MRQRAVFWRIDAARGAELLKARFIDHVYDRHVHDRYLVSVILDGAERFACRGVSHVVGPGDLTVIEPDIVHDGEPGADGGWAYRVSYFAPEALADAVEQLTGRPELPRFVANQMNDPDLVARFRRLHEAAEVADPAMALARDAGWADALSDLVTRHARVVPLVDRAGREPLAVARARAYLDAHVNDAVRLDELAALAGLSPLYLIRAFKRSTGLPPHAYQMRRRVVEACRRLRVGEAPAEVAAACGFADQSHLTRVFKRAVGVTPGAFRTGTFKSS